MSPATDDPRSELSEPRAPLALGGRGRFPKSARILERRDFDKIHHRGVRVQRPLFTVIATPSLRGASHGARFGCAVSRKVGNAVARNRLKRLMREAFRQCREGLPSIDLVVILRPGAAEFGRMGLERFASEAFLPALSEAAKKAMTQPPRGRRKGRGKPRSRGGPQASSVKK